MIHNRPFRVAIPLITLTLFCANPRAQSSASPPTLDQILHRLQANLDRYDARLPSFFCDEHVVSQVTPGRREENAVTDSIFRLKRVSNKDRTQSLAESREIRLVNGKPAGAQDIPGPSVLSGAFEGGLVVVSLNQIPCMNYSLQRIRPNHPADRYVIRFANVLNPSNTADCILQEKGSGRVFIDPATMQVARMELKVPHHVIIPESSYTSEVIGEWDIAVDYAPIQLGGETFWMPATITSNSISGSGTFHETIWSFHATYRNFHKLEVNSRILPIPESAKPDQPIQ